MTTLPVHGHVDAPAWTVRLELPVDLDQIHDLHRAAFGRPIEADLVDAIRTGATFIPELSLVAVTADGTVLGHVLISRVEFQPDAEDAQRFDILALAPIAVLPPHQSRGIGVSLIEDALSVADARDEPFTVVLGAPAFYAPFGFVPAADAGIRGPYDAAGEAFQIRPRTGEGTLDPGFVIYPPMFAER